MHCVERVVPVQVDVDLGSAAVAYRPAAGEERSSPVQQVSSSELFRAAPWRTFRWYFGQRHHWERIGHLPNMTMSSTSRGWSWRRCCSPITIPSLGVIRTIRQKAAELVARHPFLGVIDTLDNPNFPALRITDGLPEDVARDGWLNLSAFDR